MDDDIRTIGRNTDVLLNAYEEISLAVNTGKTEYMEVGCHRAMMANEHITVGIKYLGTLLTKSKSY